MSDEVRSRPIMDVVDRSLYEPIGEITVYFSNLEFMLAYAIGMLLFPGDDAELEYGHIVAAGLPFNRKLSLFADLYHRRLPKRESLAFKALCKDLENISRDRNDTLHAIWAMGDKPGTLNRLRVKSNRKTGATFRSDPTTKAHLIEIRERLALLMPRFESFVRGAKDELTARAQRAALTENV